MIGNVIKAILYGIVQGITEWLPISSTAHLILLKNFCSLDIYHEVNMNLSFWNLFKVIIQLGSILAVIVLYWRRLTYCKKDSKVKKKRTIRLWLLVIIASLPLIIGVLLDKIVDNVLSSTYIIALSLIVYGLLFIWMEKRKQASVINRIGLVMPKQALGVGLFQLLAIVPGTSRSGATILGATLLGFDRKTATEFSFFMAIPAMFGASLLKILKAKIILQWQAVLILFIGILVSFIISIFVIQKLLKYLRTNDFTVFGIYRIILGIIILFFNLFLKSI